MNEFKGHSLILWSTINKWMVSISITHITRCIYPDPELNTSSTRCINPESSSVELHHLASKHEVRDGANSVRHVFKAVRRMLRMLMMMLILLLVMPQWHKSPVDVACSRITPASVLYSQKRLQRRHRRQELMPRLQWLLRTMRMMMTNRIKKFIG